MIWRAACRRESGDGRDGCQGRLWGEVRGVDFGPLIDDGKDLGRAEIGECEIVRWREGEDVAFSRYGFRAEEEAGEVCGF